MSRLPKRMSGCLLLLIAAAVMAGCNEGARLNPTAKLLPATAAASVTATATRPSSPTRTPTVRSAGGSSSAATATRTRTATPLRTAIPKPSATPTAGLLVWIRQDNPVINVNKDPLEIRAPEPRWAGSFSKITVSAKQFTTQERYVEHGVESYDVTIVCDFDTPPLVLNPALRYKVKSSLSHSGKNASNDQSLGERFWYSTKGYANIIEPTSAFSYFPFAASFDGKASQEWMIAPPPIRSPGDTFQLSASLWNRAPCNVTWTYRAEYH